MKQIIISFMLLCFSAVTQAATVTFTVDGIGYSSTTAGVASVKSGSGCSGDVVIPESVEYNGAVYEVRTIAASAFKSNTSITGITIAKTITSIGSNAFAGCTGLTSVKWNAVNCGNFSSTASSQPFNGLTGITSIEFGDEVTKIPAYLCYGLTGLNSTLVIPSSVTSIGYGAFYKCTGITKVILEDGDEELNNSYAYYYNSGGYPYGSWGYDDVISYSYTFSACSVDSIYIGRKVKDYLFGGSGSKNTSVKKMVYGCNQNYLEKLCTGIKELTFLESVTSLSSSSIASTALREVYVYWQDPPTIAESFFTTAAYNNAILHVPEGTTDTYKSRAGWKNFTIVENVPPVIVGDVDGDGVFSIADITELIDLLLSQSTPSVNPQAYDVNNNGKIDIGDITTLIDMLLEK